MSDDIVEHPTAKKMRADAALASQTVEMLGKDRAWLEAQLEAAQARIAALEEALTEDDIEFSLRHVEKRDDQANTYALDRARAALAKGETT